MSIKRSIVIGEPKAASTSKDTKKRTTKKESTSIKRKVTKEALTPMGIQITVTNLNSMVW